MKNALLGILLGLILVGALSFFGAPGRLNLGHELSSRVQTSPVGGAVANTSNPEAQAQIRESNPVGPLEEVQVARRHRRRRAAVAETEDEASSASQPYNIVINIPACRLRLYESGKLIKVYPVCVGMPGYRSPVRSGIAINRILWNPSWGPPPGAKWAAHSSAKGPGKFNPVGKVKMPITGYVFVHGTYKIKSLGFAWSHGCFRMANEDAVELAWFLQSHAGNNQPDHTLDFYQSSHRTSLVYLKRSVPVEIIYETIEVYDGKLFVHPDIYKRGTNSEERVKAAITEAGWSANNVDINRVRWMIARSPKETAILRREDLMSK